MVRAAADTADTVTATRVGRALVTMAAVRGAPLIACLHIERARYACQIATVEQNRQGLSGVRCGLPVWFGGTMKCKPGLSGTFWIDVTGT